MTKVRTITIIMALMIAAGASLAPASKAASFNPVTQKAQEKLAALGFDQGPRWDFAVIRSLQSMHFRKTLASQ